MSRAIYSEKIGKTKYFGKDALLIKEMHDNKKEYYYIIVNGDRIKISF